MIVSSKGTTGLGAASGSTLVGAAGGATGTLVGGLTPIVLGAAAGPLGLAIGAAIAGISALLSALGVGGGCGQGCVQASNIANQVGDAMNQNITDYFAQPAPRSVASQQLALQNANTLMSQMEQACAAIPGAAGQNCISDRQAGACKWTQSTTSSLLSIPGEPQPGQCWNYVNGMIDPIANDPDVGVVSSTSNIVGDVASVFSGIPTTDLIIGGAMLAGLLMVSSK